MYETIEKEKIIEMIDKLIKVLKEKRDNSKASEVYYSTPRVIEMFDKFKEKVNSL